MLLSEDKIYIAGHTGLVGSALVRVFTKEGLESNLIVRDHKHLDLIDQKCTLEFFQSERPNVVIMAAARVGGILANSTAPSEFFFENAMIQNNVISAAHKSGVRSLIFLGSSCVYPNTFSSPIMESDLLTGPLEETNRAYAIAKIGGIEFCRALNDQYGKKFISLMPTNLYGPGDNFDLTSSHVIPALIHKVHDAKQGGADTVTLWGDGSPRREFLHVDDLAEACYHLLNIKVLPENYELINVSSNEEVSIKELSALIADVIGWDGEFRFDSSKPNGTARKKLDRSKMIAIGWESKISLRTGIERTYDWYLSNYVNND
jgi:GDP-L-fucose synthase